MSKGKLNRALDYHKKNRAKRVRTVVQFVLLIVLAALIIQALVAIKEYETPDKTKWANNGGFVALSYFGVSRSGTPDLIAKRKLDQQLEALHNQGYVTISQQDILDFYHNGKPLPEKALFLSFEDGRNDSSLYVQPYLEKYNFKATMLSYADRAGTKDPKFLQPAEMIKMTKKGFWELGSNGYRLSYINIFDWDGNLLGVKDESQFRDKTVAKTYNHYLMDFIRDENNVPIEHREEMEARITKDYDSIKEVYDRHFGFVPQVYMIMHANSLYHGMNRLVADVNDRHIRELFNMHFNREGDAYNKSDESVYDLTRVQPAPYWYTNHLLMKLQKDTGQQMKFVTGDKKRAKPWKTVSGVAEYEENRIALTSPPGARGQLYLKDSDAYTDVKLSAALEGNVIGKQAVYLRYNKEQDTYIKVSLIDNKLVVEQKKEGAYPEQLFSQEFTDIAKIHEEYPTNIKQKRGLQVTLQGSSLSVQADDLLLLDKQPIHAEIAAGGIALESEFSDKHTRDDIYDGVFDDVLVASLKPDGQESILYDNSLSGFAWVTSKVNKLVNGAVDWAIDTF